MAAISGIQKEKVQSVILCKDREFKSRAVHFLKGAAFPAEKIAVDRVEDVVSQVNSNLMMLNVVFDGSMFSPHDLEENIKHFASKCTNSDVKLLVFLDTAQANERERYDSLYDPMYIEEKPLEQAHFNRAFHGRKAKVNTRDLGPTTPASNTNDTPKQNGSLSLIEASAHIKETIEMINSLSKDRSQLAAVVNIGQRFNGLIGAFYYFANKEGFPKLLHLAEIIDAIGRTYESTDRTEISEKHYNLLVEAAKCSYILLKDLREEKGINPASIIAHDKLSLEFKSLDDIKRREISDQETVDEIVSNGLKTS